jgi:hypothetical protein
MRGARGTAESKRCPGSVPGKTKAPPERGFRQQPRARRGVPATREDQASATTLTVRRFFGPFTENSTLPSIRANRV